MKRLGLPSLAGGAGGTGGTGEAENTHASSLKGVSSFVKRKITPILIKFMSIFLTSLKKSGRLDGIHITAGIVDSRKIEKEDDYGNSGWNIFAPNLTIYGFDADPQVCEQLNRYIESRNLNWTEKHIPLALSKTLGKAKLYVTKFPGCSSLYLPNEPYIQRFSGVYKDMHKLVNTTEV